VGGGALRLARGPHPGRPQGLTTSPNPAPPARRPRSQHAAQHDEHAQAVTALGLDVDSREFEYTFGRLREEVVAHAEAEEHAELPAVTSTADAAALGQMQQALEFVPGLVAQEGGPLGDHQTTFVSMLQSARREFEGLASQRND
jgi:hypothetical protein